MQKKIFVTGGTGFLGSYLLRYLVKQGNEHITAVKRQNSPMDLVEEVKDKINWVDGDILDVPFLEEIMEGQEQVYHCAAVVSFHPRDTEKLFEINEKGTENVVNICLLHNIEKLIHVSSIAAIGRVKSGDTISEKVKWETSKLNSNYSVSKYLAEMQVWRGIAEGLNAAMVNPSLIMGSGFWDRGTAKMFRTMSKNFPFYPVGGTGMVDVRDVARFMIKLMESDLSSERFILNAEDITYKNLFSKIATSTGAKPPSYKINGFLREIAWRVEWLRSKLTGSNPLYSKANAVTTAQTFFYENKKSKEAFDFEYTPIDETINATGKQFLELKKAAALPIG